MNVLPTPETPQLLRSFARWGQQYVSPSPPLVVESEEVKVDTNNKLDTHLSLGDPPTRFHPYLHSRSRSHTPRLSIVTSPSSPLPHQYGSSYFGISQPINDLAAHDPQPSKSEGKLMKSRLSHIQSEQRRRESINAGFERLKRLLPDPDEGMTKAQILQQAADYVLRLEGLLRRYEEREYGRY